MSTITDQLGRVLVGRYRLQYGLGSGASAHVYRAFDLRLGREVALKLLHPGLGSDEAFLRRFRAEAQSVAGLSHPNLVRVFDWGFEEGEAFLVLEYLPGGSLRDLLDEGVLLSVAQAAEIGAQAARGLEHAHHRGLLHRDVKPANLLFDEEGVVRVADFGIARALADAAWTEPLGTVLGTARYASPEQAEGRMLDGASDVYALALVLYEAVTGDVPFHADTTLGTLMARVGSPLPPARALGPLYPLLAQASIPNPLARLEAGELALELERLVADLGPPPRIAPRERALPAVVAPRPLLFDGAAQLAEAAPPPVAPPPRGEVRRGRGSARRGRRRRLLAPLFLLGLALCGGAFAAKRYLLDDHVVPSLQNLTLGEATARLAHVGLTLRVSGSSYAFVAPGLVLSEQPPAGRRLGADGVVAVVLSKGPAPVAVPDVESLPLSAALAKVRAAHLVAVLRSAYSESVAKGSVLVQSPARHDAKFGSRVIVVASLGPAPRTIPNLSGEAWSAARAALATLRLVPAENEAYSSAVPVGEVVATTPAAGTRGVARGSTVVVTMSRGPMLVAVPSVQGESISAAVATLRSLGLQVNEVIGPPFATEATTTDPAPGSEVAPGTSLTLYSA